MTGCGTTGERPVHVAQRQVADGELPLHSAESVAGFTHAAMFYRGEDDLARLGPLLRPTPGAARDRKSVV